MTSQPKKILVPIGFSEQSLIALDQAAVFAKAMPAKIVLLSVLEENRALSAIFSVSEKKAEKWKNEVHNQLEEIAENARKKHGLEVETMIAKGTVYEEVARVADLIQAELVVMGTNGKPNNFKKRFIGSNAYRTVCITKAAVITIKGTEQIHQIKTIIFPLVLDRKSKEKTGPAIHYARLFGATIKAVAVATSEEEEHKLGAHLRQVKQFIEEAGVSVSAELIVPTGDMPRSVTKNFLAFAAKEKGDLVMIMEEGQQPDLIDSLLGNQVQEIIYHSDIPVMSITPSQTKWSSLFQNW